MRRWILSLGVGSALVTSLAIGLPGGAGAATLPFTGTLGLQLTANPQFQTLVVPGGGLAQVTADGSFHLLSLTIPGQAFGPVTTTLPGPFASINSLWFTDIQNLAGSFTAISGGPPGGGSMALQGLARICLKFASCLYSNLTIPLTPTAGGGVGFGIGGTQTNSTLPVAVTMQHNPWTIGQPTMTLHTPNSTIWVPILPGGFAHGPASLTSSTARPGGAVQLVTASRVFTSISGAFPEIPVSAILTLYFVPEPGTLLLLASGVVGLAVLGRRRHRR